MRDVTQREQSRRYCSQYGIQPGRQRRSFSSDASFHQVVTELFLQNSISSKNDKSNNTLAYQWEKRLLRLNRPSARGMVKLLDSRNPTGLVSLNCEHLANILAETLIFTQSLRYNSEIQANNISAVPTALPSEKIPRKGTLLEYVWNEKMRHPDKVLLIRVGEFYGHFTVARDVFMP